jgi:acyl carrier protein
MKTAQTVDSETSIYEQIALNCIGDPQCQENSEHDIRQWLLNYMSQKLDLGDHQLDDQEEFSRHFSSMELMEMLGDLETKLDRRLTPAIIIHHPNIAMLAKHLSARKDKE